MNKRMNAKQLGESTLALRDGCTARCLRRASLRNALWQPPQGEGGG
jgi:hypothetical protein